VNRNSAESRERERERYERQTQRELICVAKKTSDGSVYIRTVEG